MGVYGPDVPLWQRHTGFSSGSGRRQCPTPRIRPAPPRTSLPLRRYRTRHGRLERPWRADTAALRCGSRWGRCCGGSVRVTVISYYRIGRMAAGSAMVSSGRKLQKNRGAKARRMGVATCAAAIAALGRPPCVYRSAMAGYARHCAAVRRWRGHRSVMYHRSSPSSVSEPSGLAKGEPAAVISGKRRWK